MKAQLVINFADRLLLLEWLESVVESGALDAPGRKRGSVRVRPVDSLDVANAEQFILTTAEDGGRYLAVREEYTTEAVVETWANSESTDE
jgi:hypothetical protein